MNNRKHFETLTELKEQPWLVTESYHRVMLETLEKVDPQTNNEYALAARVAYADDEENRGWTDLGDGMAGVNIEGALLRRPSAVEQAFFGLTSTSELKETLLNLAADPKVSGVLLIRKVGRLVEPLKRQTQSRNLTR